MVSDERQISLLSDAWMRREELRNFANLVINAFNRGHLDQPKYDHATSWPSACRHRVHGDCLAWMQRTYRTRRANRAWSYTRERSPDRCNAWRIVVTDGEGFVVDESAWCATEGDARDYHHRRLQLVEPPT